MTQRDTLLVVGGVLLAAAVSVLLLASVLVRQGPAGRPGVVVGRSPVPTARPIAELERRLPVEFRFLAPILPVQRGVSDVARGAAGLLLVLVVTSSTLVLAREQVVRAHAASVGGLAEQARVLGVGVGVLVVIASAVLLGWVFLLTSVIGQTPQLFLFGLQVVLALFAIVLLILGIAALLGFCVASWRFGVRLLTLPAWRRAGEQVPAAAATLLGATLLYLAAQLPVVGPLISALVLAYSLGAFVLGRLAPTANTATERAGAPPPS